MSSAPNERRAPTEAGPDTRAHFRRLWDVAFVAVRFIARHAHNTYATFGIFVLAGAAIAVAGTWAFAELAGHVSSGGTQAFDDAVLQWLGQRRTKPLDAFMLDITSLGTSSVVASPRSSSGSTSTSTRRYCCSYRLLAAFYLTTC
jgi:microcystin degradation protein MlrC